MGRAAVIVAMVVGIGGLAGAAPRSRSRTIYLNRGGASLRPGVDDARTQTSSLVPHAVDVPAYAVSDADWAATLACMTDLWSQFDVTITDVDPGSVPHMEAVFAQGPTDLGLAQNLAGLAPFATDCSVVENSIVFTFTAKLPHDPRRICEVTSEELGHSYGLDHELAAADPMSHLAYAGARTFQDVDATCGESTARPCGGDGAKACRATQNSVQLLRARLGVAGGDDVAPLVVVRSPAAHSEVEAGFVVEVAANDDVGVTAVTLAIDGVVVSTVTTPSMNLTTDAALAPGPHVLRIEATDGNGNVTAQEVDVVVMEAGGCSVSGHGGVRDGVAVLLGLMQTLRRRRR